MAITKMQQSQISGSLVSRMSDQVSNANLAKAGRTLDDDLNSLRTQARLIMGTSAWTDNLSGSQSLAKIYGALRVEGANADFQGALDVTGIATFDSILNVDGAVDFDSTLDVAGAVNMQSTLQVAQSITGSGTLTVSGQGLFSSGVTVAGLVDAGTLNVGGGFGSSGVSISSAGNIQADGTLSVGGTATVAGQLNASGGVVAANVVSVGSGSFATLAVSGAAAADSLAIGGGFGSTGVSISSSGNIQADGTLSVSGASTLASLGVTGAATVGSTLAVTGQVNAIGGISAANVVSAGSGSFASLAVSGAAAADSLAIGGGFGSSGVSISSSGNIQADGTLSVSGASTLASLGVVGAASVGGNLVVTGDLTVNGTTVTIDTTNLLVEDPLVGFGFTSGSVASAVGDRGFIGGLSGENNVAMFWDESADKFAVARTNSTPSDTSINVNSYADFRAAAIEGTVITATAGFSGSLQKLADGSDYLLAGAGIQIVKEASGAITISNSATSDTAKGYILGNSAYINTGNNEITFGSGGAGIGTLNTPNDEFIDVYLNGVYLAYGYDITAIAGNKVTLAASIVSTLTADDIISFTLRDLA